MRGTQQGSKSDGRSVLLLWLLRGGIFLRPLTSGFDGSFLVFLPGFGDFGSERIVGVGGAEEGLDGEEDGADLKSRGPVVYGKEVGLDLLSSLETDEQGQEGKSLLFSTSRQMRPSLSTLG